jgi:hypothetical protein
MTKMLVAVLVTACVVNVACLLGHFYAGGSNDGTSHGPHSFIALPSRTSAGMPSDSSG